LAFILNPINKKKKKKKKANWEERVLTHV
jgi:hypothetical protein